MSSMDLSRRCHDPEIMDDLTCSGETVRQTLRELDMINRFLGGNAVTLSGLRELLLRHNPRGGPLTVADLGCGSGDLLRRLADYGRSRNIRMQLTGVDANPFIVSHAREHCRDYPEIQLETENVFSDAFSRRRFDIITGTLFFHHFDDNALARLIRQLVGQCRMGLLINDIHRHTFAYHSIRLLTRFFSSSTMVKYDAPLSVRRAFTRADWEGILQSAGLHDFRMSWKWAFRWQILIGGIET